MSVRVAINGFGRVGRCALRAAHAGGADVEIVAINDVMDVPTLAHLLRYDSVFGRFPGVVDAGEDELVIDGTSVRAFAEKDPTALPWQTSVSMW